MSTKASFRFFTLLALYFVVLTIIKSFGSLEFDDAEQAIVSTHLAFGYENAQPPLYNYLQWLFFKIFGYEKIAILTLKHLVLFGIYFANYALAKLLTQNEDKALMAAILTIFLPQIFWQSELMLTHSVLATLFGICFFYIIALIYKKGSSPWLAVLLGLILAGGFLSKYSFLLFGAALVLFWIARRDFRMRFPLSHLLLSLFTLLLFSLPHLLWLASHLQAIKSATLHKTIHHHTIFQALWSFLKSIFLFLTPFWIVVLLIKKEGLEKIETSLFTLLSLVFVELFILILLGYVDSFKERWFLPFLAPLPALVAPMYRYTKRVEIAGYILLALMVLFFAVRIFWPPKMTNSNIPVKALVEKLPPFTDIESSNIVLRGNFLLYRKDKGKIIKLSKREKPGYEKICAKKFCLYIKVEDENSR